MQMNKQEAIEKLMSKSREVIFGDDENVYLSRKRTIELVSQIDEPQKVTIPKFVAEWIEECKRSGWHLQKVLSRLDDDEKIGDWAYDENDDLISEKVDMIASDWLFGYKVEQEKLYTVEIPNPNNEYSMNVLIRLPSGKIALVALHKPNTSYLKNKEYQLTESEIKKDFEWAWQWAKPVEEN